MRFGYKASAEQFGARQLLDYSKLAEQSGFDVVAVSDHFQPWRHTSGQAPNALVWLGAIGEATQHVTLGTSVLTPTMRYHPSIIAQAFGTLGCLNPGRVFLGVGTGEAMNETPATGQEWPGPKERRQRLAEAIELIRRLWSEERVTFEGNYYQTLRATLYDRPETPIPIYLAASGELAAQLAGRVADGFICTSGKALELYETLLAAVGEGARQAGRETAEISKMIELKVSYDPDPERAERDCGWWAGLALSAEEKMGIEDPLELERLADANRERASSRFIVSDDPEEVVERITVYAELGFTELIFHAPGYDQARAINLIARDVLPSLRDRYGGTVPTSG